MDVGLLILGSLLKIVFVLVILLTFAPVLVWAERRQSAMMQDRVGPMQGGFVMPQAVLGGIPAAQLALFGLALLAFLGAVLNALLLGYIYFATHEWITVEENGATFSQLALNGSAARAWDSTGRTAATLLLLGGIATPALVTVARGLPLLFHNGRLTVFGLLHPAADAIKMIWKEDITPPNADKFLFALAPIIAVVPAFAVFAVIPFGPEVHWDWFFSRIPHTFFEAPIFVEDPTTWTRHGYPLQIANINVGILFIFAIAGTGVVGAAIAGYSSDNKYALLGGLRAASQMVSYEVTLGLSLVPVFMIYNTLQLNTMVEWQRGHVWGIFVQPLAFILFAVAGIAEYKRVPFDAPEGESEIVAGYFVEYSGMKWGMYMMGEFIEVVTSSALITTIFLGGGSIPFLSERGWSAGGYDFSLEGTHFVVLSDFLNSHGFFVVAQVLVFLLKVGLLCFLSLQIRWTLPRFRYDQTMQLCWKLMLPLALLNILVTGIVILAWS